MIVSFTKMQGSGNDFIVLDNREGRFRLNTGQIQRLCHRRFGIGADGVIFLERPPGAHLDARMIYHNSDGSRGEMCGNGARCFTSFALSKNLGRNGVVRFLTDAGPMSAALSGEAITVQMTPPADLKRNIDLTLRSGSATVHYVNTGVPHVVRFVEDVSLVDIRAEGAELRHHKAFAPKGANANFAHLRSDGTLQVRTFERGVEDETLACGTGVTATAILAHLVLGLDRPVRLLVAGGDILQVDFESDGEAFRNVTLTGPATVVYDGTIEL
jgi:diaminopimelate epimerase